MSTYFISQLHDGQQWHSRCLLDVDASGLIERLHSQVDDSAIPGDAVPLQTLIPGLPNLHSHAFQRAMAGRAEQRASDGGSFWSWREQMYRIAHTITPEQMEIIATQLYLELRQSGYTRVCEFHYLHHDRDGQPYEPVTTMAEALIRASTNAGIELTLLPVLYSYSGFGQRPLTEEQRRFGMSTAEYLAYLETLEPLTASAGCQIGIALHSLRAVSTAQINEVLAHTPADWPVHIHISEQMQEVRDCQQSTGLRPVELLLEEVEVCERWCLVHATHLSNTELEALAQRSVTVALCPTTEANLGDGLFPMLDFINHGGRYGIGSDSQICRSASEELRWLEYGQRLIHQRRCLISSSERPSTGENLWLSASLDKQAVTAGHSGRLDVGQPATFVELQSRHASMIQTADQHLFDGLVFSADPAAIHSVTIAGQRQTRQQIERQLNAHRSLLEKAFQQGYIAGQ